MPQRTIEPYRDPTLPERLLRWFEAGIRRRFASIPCYTESDGSPEGVIDGQKADRYYDLTADEVYIKTTNTGNTGWVLITTGGGDTTFQGLGQWRYRTTTGGTPGAGQLEFDNADINLATEFYLNVTNDNGVDMTTFLGLIQANDLVYIQVSNSSAQYVVTQVGLPVLAAGVYTFPIILAEGVGGAPSNNTPVSVVTAAAAGGGGGNMNTGDPETVTALHNYTVGNTPPGAGSALTTDMLFLDAKEAIDGNDAFLRLNQNGDFASGIYTPGNARIDGTLDLRDPTGARTVTFIVGGADLDITSGSSVANIDIVGFTGNVQLQGGVGLRIDSLGSAGNILFTNDGTTFTAAATSVPNVDWTGLALFTMGSYSFDVDQVVGAGQDNFVLTYDDGTGLISLEAAGGGGPPFATPLDIIGDINMATPPVAAAFTGLLRIVDNDETDVIGTFGYEGAQPGELTVENFVQFEDIVFNIADFNGAGSPFEVLRMHKGNSAVAGQEGYIMANRGIFNYLGTFTISNPDPPIMVTVGAGEDGQTATFLGIWNNAMQRFTAAAAGVASFSINTLGGDVIIGGVGGGAAAGDVTLGFDQATKLKTFLSGIFVYSVSSTAPSGGTVGADTSVEISTRSASPIARMGVRASDDVAYLGHDIHGRPWVIEAQNAVGSDRIMAIFNPVSGSILNIPDSSSVGAARTVILASGGLEVNNTVTGAGFERVLTVSDIGGAGSELKVKTATQTVNNSTVMVADNHLTGFTLEAGEFYKFHLEGEFVTGATPDMDIDLVFTNATQNGRKVTATINQTALGDYENNPIESEERLIGAAGSQCFRISGWFQANATTGGTVGLEWAQGTADASNTQILLGAWMEVTKTS